MKRIVFSLLLLIAPALVGAQTNVAASGGSITRVGTTLMVPLTIVTSFGVGGDLPVMTSGLVTIQTGAVLPGATAEQAMFRAGGSLVIWVPGQMTYTGTIGPGATWRQITNADETYQYELTGTATDGNGNVCNFVLLTVNTGTEGFAGTAGVESVDFSL